MSTGKGTPTKRKAGVAGFVQFLSPKKISRNGNPYYTFQVQTTENECVKGACFSPYKEKELRRFEESKSPVDLSGIVVDEKGVVLVNSNSKVTDASFTDVPFQYNLMDKLEKDVVSAMYEVAGLLGEEPGTDRYTPSRDMLYSMTPLLKQ